MVRNSNKKNKINKKKVKNNNKIARNTLQKVINETPCIFAEQLLLLIEDYRPPH